MLLQIGPLLRLGSKCYYRWDFYYAWVQMLLRMGPLLHLGPVITLVPSTTLSALQIYISFLWLITKDDLELWPGLQLAPSKFGGCLLISMQLTSVLLISLKKRHPEARSFSCLGKYRDGENGWRFRSFFEHKIAELLSKNRSKNRDLSECDDDNLPEVDEATWTLLHILGSSSTYCRERENPQLGIQQWTWVNLLVYLPP